MSKLTCPEAKGLVSTLAEEKDKERSVLSRSAKAAYLSDSAPAFVGTTGSDDESQL